MSFFSLLKESLLCLESNYTEAEQQYELGMSLPDSEWSLQGDAVVNDLIKTGEKYWFVRAGEDWPDRRWDKRISDALEPANFESWDNVLNAGMYWKQGRFLGSPRLLGGLINSREADTLYLAGLDFPDHNYSPKIAKALLKAGDAEWIQKARTTWKAERVKDLET